MAQRTILYYPKLYLEDGLWLRACAMHFDKIATIVPCRAAAERKSEAIKILEEAGMYEPVSPKVLFEDKKMKETFINEMYRDMRKRRIISKQYYGHRQERFDAISKLPALLNKVWTPFERDELPQELLERLLEYGILMKQRNGQLWMSDAEAGTQIYYGIMARYLAFMNKHYMQLGTDGLDYHEYPFGEATDTLSDTRLVFMNVLMQRVLPVPAKDVPLQDIIAFRQENKNELEILDTVIEDFVKRIYRCRNVEKLREITYQYQEELEFALDNFLYYLEQSGMPYDMQSIKQILPIGIHPAVENSHLKGQKDLVLVTSATRETELLVQFKAQCNKDAAWSGLVSERALYIYDSKETLVSIR